MQHNIHYETMTGGGRMDSASRLNPVFWSPWDGVWSGLADAGRDQEQCLTLLGQCVEVSGWLVDEAGELHGS